MRIYFIDLDDVVVKRGTHELLPGALSRLQELNTKGEIWFFSSWAFTARDQHFLNSLPGIQRCEFLRKPLADEYVFIDDKLIVEECDVKL